MESWPKTWETQKSRKGRHGSECLDQEQRLTAQLLFSSRVLALNIATHLEFFVIPQLAYRVYKSVTGETFFFFFFFKPEKP